MNNTPPPIPPLALPAPEPEPDPAPATPPPAPNPWIARALATAATVGIAAAYLVFDHSPGAGWAAFTVAIVVAIAANRDRTDRFPAKRTALLAALLIATAAQAVLRPSATGTLVSLLLAAYAAATLLSPERFPFIRTLLEGVTKVLAAPLRPFQSVRHAGTVGRALRTTTAPLLTHTASTRRWVSIVLPAALVVLPFVVLLSLGNRVLGDSMHRLFVYLGDAFYKFELPSVGHVVFATFVAVLTLALLWRTKPSRTLARITSTLQKSFPGPADQNVALWRTVLALAGVNAVFFAANTLDAVYLWAKTELPEHLTLSQFVHHGTANLILSVLTAAAVLSAIFQQHQSVTGSKLVRHLAVAWIAQNLFLASSVALRNVKYIVDGYGLSLERLYLFVFLTLVAAGFVLLAVRVLRDRSFAWLVGANLTALFAVGFATQFWDTRAFVAERNFHLAQQWKVTHTNHLYIDTNYLADLGPSAWPTLIAIANATAAPENKPGFAEHEIANARRRLAKIADTQLAGSLDLPWQSYSHHRARSLAALGEYQVGLNATAQNGHRE